MKVICIANRLTDIQRLAINEKYNPPYSLTVDKIYTVLAFTAQTSTSSCPSGPFLQVKNDVGSYGLVPICLFDIIDPRPSRFWQAKKLGDFDLALWPEEFYQEYFHDDLSNDEPAVVEKFRQVVEKLEHEFD